MDVNAIKDQILAVIKGAAKDFWDGHQDVRDIVEERARRMAELAIEYAMASDAERPGVVRAMETVAQTCLNLLDSVALDAETAAKESFKSIVNVVLESAVKLIPVLVATL